MAYFYNPTTRLYRINWEVKRKNLVKSVKSCGYKS